MKKPVRLFVIITAFVCHPLFLAFRLAAQVPSQLQAAQTPKVIQIKADTQEKTGDLYHLAGHVEIVDGDTHLSADRMDYNETTGVVNANGNVHYVRLKQNEEIWANRGEYNVRQETGNFFDVVGSVGGLVRTRTSIILTTSNPLFFEAERVDRIDENTYQLHNATITVCTLPDPTWTFTTPEATIHPDESAVLHHPKFRLLKIPVFYFPYYYRSLRRLPRNTGFLTPVFGNSSTLGPFLGDSFFWAINRSTDLELGGTYLSKRGISERGTFRWRPWAGSYLNVSYFGVEDRGIGSPPVKQGGRSVHSEGVAPLPDGFRAVVDLNYLSSLTFRQAFTQTYYEAVSSDVHSTAFVTKNFNSFSFNSSLSLLEDFQSNTPGNTVKIHHLPEFELNSVERPMWEGSPLRLSWDSSAGVVSRTEPAQPTTQATTQQSGAALKTSAIDRLEFYPRVTLPLHWRGIHLTPVLGYRAQHWGGEREGEGGPFEGVSLNRGTEQLSVELVFPTLSKIFASAGPLYKHPFKHVLEPKVTYLYVNGVKDFVNTLLFDDGDLVTNTSQVELSLTNRLLAKKQPTSSAQEVLSWELKQQYYFDPTFGGALQPGLRNVFLSTLDFNGDAFLDAPRRFSPVVSILRFRPFAHYNIEFREDYDTTLHRFTNGGLLVNTNWGDNFASVGEFSVHDPTVNGITVLAPPSDQVQFTVGHGRLGRTGFNAVYTAAYDIRSGFLQFSAFQVSWNNNCCGISFEFRRFALGPVRNENQYRIAFSLANIGSFGNMKKQERLF